MNKWKLAFFALLGALVIGAGILVTMILAPVEDGKEISRSGNGKSDTVKLHVRTNKDDLNRVISHYLAEESEKGSVDYQVNLNEDVEFYGTIPLFKERARIKATFEPSTMDNGDIVLRQKSLSVGNLHLPVSYMLRLLHRNGQLPKFVHIQPDEETIYVSLKEIELKRGAGIRAEKFDLKEDNIAFTLLLPAKK
ncbi:YpmS family protein [Bacillus massilinigeriensis]|uniref:YpmS family protein n=1 Tax=Bacillus mediterraneensis TaxID=1805474 RepID=UPI0008F8A442|nr:YpmS family protein [Bacillus mediterraneensis]